MDLMSLICSLGINGLILGYFQLSGIHDHKIIFKLTLEVCLIFFNFQLGAIYEQAQAEISLEDYFFKTGGELIVFTIACLFLCSVASIFVS